MSENKGRPTICGYDVRYDEKLLAGGHVEKDGLKEEELTSTLTVGYNVEDYNIERNNDGDITRTVNINGKETTMTVTGRHPFEEEYYASVSGERDEEDR